MLPLTAFTDALRASMIDGAGLAQLLPELGMRVAWTVIPFVIGLEIFRWV